jgi:prophage regulatory protein
MKILRDQEVGKLTGLSRVTRWRLERDGKFPKRIKIGVRAVGWCDEEIFGWIKSRPQVGASL